MSSSASLVNYASFSNNLLIFVLSTGTNCRRRMLRTRPFISFLMEFPAGQISDNIWSHMYDQSPIPTQTHGENGFLTAGFESSGPVHATWWRAAWNLAVRCVRTVVENTADCQRSTCTRLRTTVPRRVYGTTTSSIEETIPSDRFAGASAPPRPEARSAQNNSDSPPYMPSGSRRVNGTESSNGNKEFRQNQRQKYVRDLPV